MKDIKKNGHTTKEELCEDIIFKKNNLSINFSRTLIWSMVALKVKSEDSEIKITLPEIYKLL